MLSWLMVLRIEYKVRVWMSEAKRSREGGYKHHIALTLAGADEKARARASPLVAATAESRARRVETRADPALAPARRAGRRGSRGRDHRRSQSPCDVRSHRRELLVQPPTGQISLSLSLSRPPTSLSRIAPSSVTPRRCPRAQLLTPLKIGWGAYGLVLYERANRCKGGSDLNELLDVFVFCFVFTLGFSFIHLIIWTFGFMLKFDAVRDYVRAKFVDFDATSGLAYPVATEFFDRVIMRNRQQTEHDARVKECARLRRERKLVESKLTSIDEQVRLSSRARCCASCLASRPPALYSSNNSRTSTKSRSTRRI